ncbi:PREDICTED: WD repeat-containing and planar cell polarity effector protein fritz isoform X2 [Dinoponera quadriceps]|uniref:WD repeat-containing and planar cell polarity effector protein fritz isoform X2 n=1 Tax=Dinoponera quadriceps TaxID=609295 RepID=A0A6P3Y195_DINQU|nr:PREDICTED: WD repeat-containing and planar cell polarity effector protein fritz isoform X2 [Dinoponera quadriceps]
MFALMGELKLWTFDDNVNIRDTDFGAFKYHDKRINGTHQEGKRSYCEKRDMIYVPVNKKGSRLKDYIKYLEDQLRDNSIIYCQWYSDRIAQLMFSNGLLAHIQIYPFSGDIEKINFDKYLVGKLSEHASDVIITKSHIVCTYNDNEVTVVYLTKPKNHVFDNINKLEPKLITTDVFVPNGRKLDKKVQVNKSEDLILIWWKSTMNEVYPWSPAMREYHRANMHLFRLTGTKLESLCYIRTEFDPLCITFDACDDNIIHSVEQKVSRKGEVTVEWRTYEVSQQNKLQRIAVISVPLPTHTSCVKFSPNQELLLLCCIDGTVTMYDPTKAITTSARAAFIPTLAAWHSDGMIFVLGNDRGQLQHFNVALQCIKSQTLSDEATPANILDLSPYFRNQPALIHMEWNKKSDPNYVGFYNNGNSLFLLLFERGPIGVLKVIEGDCLTGDELIRRYLSGCQIKQATCLLLSMNWDTHPRACMHSLNQILNYLFKLPLTTNHDGLIQNALGSFHVPARPISQAVEEEYGNEVRDLTRRYFHRLLRCRMFEKAFRLAIDLNDHDLFMDIHFSAVALNDTELAIAAKGKAESILSRSNSRRSSHSTCSRASCSLCSDSSDEKGEEEEEETYSEESGDSRKRAGLKQLKRHNYRKAGSNQIPPLPVVPAPYTDIPSSKSDYSLMPASFDTSSGILTATSFNHSSPSPFLASTSFNQPLYKTNFASNAASMLDSSSAFNNASDDLMTTSFGSLSLTESEVTADEQSLLNDIPYSFNGAPAAQGDTFVSTAFNKPVYESEDAPADDYPASSLLDSNVMSTSFSTLVSHSKPESPPGEVPDNPPSRTEALATSKSVLYGTSNNLMSTSFNYPEADAAPISDAYIDAFSSDQPVKLQHPVAEKKETAFSIPPPSSLTSVSYLHGLPRKNFPLSRSSPGLTSDIDESVHKFSPYKATHIVLQRQNSASNIPQKTSSRIYRYNYDLDYVPFHHGAACDDADPQRSPQTAAATGGRKFDPMPNFQPSYSVQRRLLESRHHLLRSSQSVNASKEAKMSCNVPPLPVIGTASSKIYACPPYGSDAPVSSNEKPKVKFSDTVTHILVPPGAGQVHRQKRPPVQAHSTDHELAESLPLGPNNEDYLKDLPSLSKDNTDEKIKESPKSDDSTKIKVVHFGLL